jgi:uncharacterized membrane protein
MVESCEASDEIPPEIMEQLRAQIMADQAAVAEAVRVPDVSGFSESVQKRCMFCHADQAAMLKSADGVLLEEEMFRHTLFANDIEFYKPMGVTRIFISPTNGVDIVKDPNEICLLWQQDYPGVQIHYVYQNTTAGEYLKYECQLIRGS